MGGEAGDPAPNDKPPRFGLSEFGLARHLGRSMPEKTLADKCRGALDKLAFGSGQK